MIKRITLIISVLFLISCGQSEIDLSQISIRNGLAYQVNKDKPFTGNVVKKMSNEQIIISGSYKDGKKEGEWLEYYNNGQLKKRENYSSGNYDGKFESYNKNGSPIILTNYSNGKLNNNYKEYNRKNVLISDIDYDNGNYNGSFKKFNDNGILITNTNYKNGSIDGLYTNYYENGNKKLEYSMNNNKYVNEYIMYNNDGVVKTQFDYSNGSKKNKGTWKKYWNKDWEIVDIPSYYYSTVSFDNNGNVSSKVKFYYQNNNKLQSEHTYKSLEPDFREGESIWYSENGKITMKGTYKNNERNGKWETFYETKNTIGTYLKESANYTNGKMNGSYLFIGNSNETIKNDVSSSCLRPNGNGSWLVGYKPQTDYGYWKLEGHLTNGKLDKTWKIWLLRRDNKCYYKIDVYSTALWDKGNEVENSYLNLHKGFMKKVYNKNGVRFTSFWGDYAKEKMKTLKPYYCGN